MEKYYDLIVSLIKANRRYPGCESVIDDIVADVYAHAEVVLNSVTNENVISSYLNKIVTTSMITVPRKLGIKTEAGQTSSIDIKGIIQNAEQINTEPDETPAEELAAVNADEPLTLEMNEEDSLAEETEEITEQLPEVESYELNEDNEDTVEELTYDEYGDENEDEEEEYSDYESENEDINIEPSVPDVDQSLVEKMINGVSPEDSGIQLPEESPEDNIDSLLEIDETEELPEENESLDSVKEEDTAELLAMDNSEDLSEEELLLSEALEEGPDELSESEIDEEPSETEPIENNTENEDVEPQNIESLDNAFGFDAAEISEINDLDEIQEFDSLDINIDEELEELPEIDDAEELSETNIINADLIDDAEELSETNVNPDETIQEIGDSQSLYKYFEFTPQNSEPNMAPVYSAINEFQSQRHDIDVTRLLKLKYKDKLSINEISAELGLPDETILQLLGEIGYVVKEQ